MKDSKAAVKSETRYLCDMTFAQDERWLLAQRIVASKSFVKSSFLINFLLYICDRQITGRTDDITEYQIGIHALGRPSDYNPGDDNVVRNYARLLRTRLEEYFLAEGRDEVLRITIPRGRYYPVFDSQTSPQQLSTVLTSPTVGPDENSTSISPGSTWKVKLPAWAKLCVLSACIVAVVGSAFLFVRSHEPRPPASNPLWAAMFRPDRETLVVPADSGFGILQNLSRQPIHLSDYVNGDYVTKTGSVAHIDARNLNDLGIQRYTSMADLNTALAISHEPEVVSSRFAIRYARDVRMEEIKHANVFLIGSLHTNPWVELFEKSMNFTLEYQAEVDDSVIINRHPRMGELSTYKNASDEDSHRTFAVLAFMPSLDGQGHVILLEGLNMAGTQAAADFLLNPRTMDPILQKARNQAGYLEPFELLLETNSIGANAPAAEIVAERYGEDQTVAAGHPAMDGAHPAAPDSAETP
jgi:hypothetical protein